MECIRSSTGAVSREVCQSPRIWTAAVTVHVPQGRPRRLKDKFYHPYLTSYRRPPRNSAE